eukprot:jgi/Psemu1/302449/fgenesh1_kg.69_\
MGTKVPKENETTVNVEEGSIPVGNSERHDNCASSSRTQSTTADISRTSSRKYQEQEHGDLFPSSTPPTVIHKQKRGKRNKQHEKERRNTTRSEEFTKKTMKRERKRFREGTHPDLPRIHRNYRERRIKEDTCIICLEGNADGKPVEMFSACCDQAYHVSCYIRQLSFDNVKHGSPHECGVCRTALPDLEDDGMYIKSFTRGRVSSARDHTRQRKVRHRNFLHSNDICYSSDDRPSSGDLRLYLFTRDDYEEDGDQYHSSEF